MNQQNQGSGSSNPSSVPTKRKRGRPRKEECTAQVDNKPVRRGSDNVINSNQTAGTTGGADDEMLGKVVTGVIDGCFGAGYLLNVRVGDTQTYLRGAVFLPGQYTPVTPENDVAPHLEMLQRKDFPIPVLNPQAQMQSSIPSSGQGSKQPVEPKPLLPNSKDQVLPTEIHYGAPFSLENQSTSVPVPMANMPKNDSSISAGGIPRDLSDPGHVSKPASIMLEMECDKVAGQDMHKHDTSRQVKEPSADGGAEKHSELTPEAMNLLPTTENIDKELQTGQHTRSSVHKLNEQIQDEPKISNIELNQMPVSAGPEPMQSEQIQDELKNSNIKVNQMLVSAEPEAIQSEQIHDEPKNSNMELNQMPVSAEPKSIQSEQIHDEPKNSTIQLNQMPVSAEPEDIQSVDKFVDKQDSPKPALETSHPSTLFQGGAVPSESRFASEGSNLPGMSDSQNRSPSGETTKEADIQPNESSVMSVEPENPIGPDIL